MKPQLITASRALGHAVGAILCAGLLNGCATLWPAPPAASSTPTVPATFATHGPAVTSEAPLPTFWSSFGDPVLPELVSTAWRQNRDLGLTLARLREAQGLRHEQAFDYLPTVRASAGRAAQQTALVDAPTLSAAPNLLKPNRHCTARTAVYWYPMYIGFGHIDSAQSAETATACVATPQRIQPTSRCNSALQS